MNGKKLSTISNMSFLKADSFQNINRLEGDEI